MAGKSTELPFSARYSLPVQVAEDLKDVSWETVVELSSDFQFKAEEKRSKVRSLIRELQLTRMLLVGKIKRGTKDGRIDPRLLVELVKLLQRCEEVTKEYEVDLGDFSNFVFLLIEKLKKEKLAKHSGDREMRHMRPIGEELSSFKTRAEPLWKDKPPAKAKKKKK
jgi:hypothetical protein